MRIDVRLALGQFGGVTVETTSGVEGDGPDYLCHWIYRRAPGPGIHGNNGTALGPHRIDGQSRKSRSRESTSFSGS
jgi:hypothetical protein